MTGMVTREMREMATRTVLKQIGNYDRGPFRTILAELIGAAPTADEVKAFAAKSPDKWAQAVTMFAGLAGFEKGMVSLNFFNVGAMSDVALLAELAAGDEALAKLGLKRERPPVTIENPPQAVAGPADGFVVGTGAGYAEKLAEVAAPGPAAPERAADGGYVDPAGAV